MTLAELYGNLTEDPWRTAHPFSKDMLDANIPLNYVYSRDPEFRVAMEHWLQRHQPCLFGRIAAKNKGIHYCFITGDDIRKSDEHVRAKIAESRRLWKQRALIGQSRHGFLLAVCDQRIAYANPDQTLRKFALHLQSLAGWAGRPTQRNNEVVDETLYLRHPTEPKKIVKFVFSVDFFAAGGDGRWWHDHRIPGGIAFTANSLGHMARHLEWYKGETDLLEWGLRTAMLTIDSADKTPPDRPATYMLTELPTGPIRPYTWTEITPLPDAKKLSGYDCGSYGGYLHTDHCVRPEFFLPQEVPLWREDPYLMEFSYIVDPGNPDHLPFMIGHPVTEEEVYAELGTPETWTTIGTGDTAPDPEIRPPEMPQDVQEALARCRSWKLTDEEAAAILPRKR
jgi:hypothetical protein